MTRARGGVAGVALALLVAAGAAWWLVAGAGQPVQAQEDEPGPAPLRAAFLALAAVPDTLPADREGAEALFVQLLGPDGEAIILPETTTVSLTSSDPRTVTVPPTATVPAGESAVVVPVTVSGEGSATISARAAGLTSAQTTVTGVSAQTGIEGGQLAVAFAPTAMIAGAGGPAWVTVSLLAPESEQPMVASEDVTVRLLSSNIDALDVPATATIPAGSYYATVPVEMGASGSATVVALRSGLSSGSASVTVRATPSAEPPRELAVVSVPRRALPNGMEPVQIVIQARDGNGAATAFPCGALQLATDAPAVLQVPDQSTPACEAGQQAVVVEATPGNAAGTAVITVAARGLESGETSITSRGQAPQRLAAAVAPPVLVYGHESAGWLVVQVRDSANAPAPVGAPVTVALDGPPGVVPSEVTVPARASFVLVPLGALAPGQTGRVEVSAPGLSATSVELVSPGAGMLVRPAGPAATGPRFPRFEVAGMSIPVPVLLGVVLLALIALVAMSVLSMRRERYG